MKNQDNATKPSSKQSYEDGTEIIVLECNQQVNPLGVCGCSVIHSAMQDELLMAGFFEGIIDATLWLPGGLFGNVPPAAAFKSPTVQQSNFQEYFGMVVLGCLHEIFY